MVAINGIACGGGLELALSGDILLAAAHARLALSEVRSGTVADAASVKLPRRIPCHVAMELLLIGRWFVAEEAARWGLVNRVLPAERPIAEARALADDVAYGPPLVFAAVKEIVREADDMIFPGRAGPDHAQPVRDGGAALRFRGPEGGRARLRRETRSRLEGEMR